MERSRCAEHIRALAAGVVVVGLPGRLRSEVAAVLPQAAIETIRGKDRYETSALLAEALLAKIGAVECVVVAPGGVP